jgi:hypothetical protein
MKTSVVGFLLVSVAALVSAAFAGHVKTQLDSLKASGHPEVFSIENGTYTCSSCKPEIKIKADGYAHKVPANSVYDQLSVKVKDQRSIEIGEQMNGKNRAWYSYVVSPDGKTLTVNFSDYSSGKEELGGYTATRVGTLPPGAHPVSGSWKIEQVSEKYGG